MYEEIGATSISSESMKRTSVAVKEAQAAFKPLPRYVWNQCLLSPGQVTFLVGEAHVSVNIPSLTIEDYVVADSHNVQCGLAEVPLQETVQVGLQNEKLFIGGMEIEREDREWQWPANIGEPVGQEFVLPPIHPSLLAAASPDQTRDNLHAIYVSPKTGKMCASNGHILVEFPLGYRALHDGGVIPLEVMQVVQKLGEVRVQLYSVDGVTGFAVLTSKTAEIITPLAGEFPDYDQVMPKSIDKEIKLPKKQLLELLKKWMKTLKAEWFNGRSPGLKCTGKGDTLEIEVEHKGVKLIERLAVPGVGDSVWGINCKYLRTILEAFPGEVLMKIGANGKDGTLDTPMLFTDGSIRAVAMPMRIF